MINLCKKYKSYKDTTRYPLKELYKNIKSLENNLEEFKNNSIISNINDTFINASNIDTSRINIDYNIDFSENKILQIESQFKKDYINNSRRRILDNDKSFFNL